MRNLLFLLQFFLLKSITLSAQVGIGTDTPDPSAVLDLKGNGKQGLLLPQVDHHDSIKNPKPGLIAYDKHKKSIVLYDGNDWIEVQQSVITANKVNKKVDWNKVNTSKIKCNTFDPHAFDHLLKDKKLAHSLAEKFAPILRFDKDVYDDYYPTSLKNIFKWSDPSSINCGGKLSTHDTDKHKGGKYFPTYYGVQENPYNKNRVFIDYWLCYIRQSDCEFTVVKEKRVCIRYLGCKTTPAVSKKGWGHDYDWEHIVIQVSKTTDKVYSVTYFQHSGWYTRKWDNIEKDGNHPVAYVGRKCHGMYYDDHNGSSESCLYFQDSREPTLSTTVSAKDNLKEMSSDAYGFGFNGDFGNSGKGPLYRNRKYWEYKTCNGDAYTSTKATQAINGFPQSGCKDNNYNYDKSLQIGNIPN